MISLKLESATDSLDLGALLNGTEGVQAIRGLTGAGLPPVSVQWSEGAGDGATYRGKRVLPRDVDIPLYIAADSRAGLLSLVRRLTMILADEATLRLSDSGGDAWTLKVARVGGGDFIYGVDTDGETDLALSVTLRAGQPYWTSVETIEVVKSTFTTTTLELNNPGSVATPPVWEVRGPGKNLNITAPSGERLTWNGTLLNGETLFIDSATGSLTDASGTNRYANLAQAPRFAKVQPQLTSSWHVEYPNVPASLIRTNLVPNPTASMNTTGWTPFQATVAASSRRFSMTPTANASFSLLGSGNIPGIAAGNVVTLSAKFSSIADRKTQITIIWLDSAGGSVGTASGPRLSDPLGTVRNSFAATAPAGATQVQILLNMEEGSTPVPIFYISEILLESSVTVGSYFDGDTTDTSNNTYAWSGTAGASTSTLTFTPNDATRMVRCRIKPREWMVI